MTQYLYPIRDLYKRSGINISYDQEDISSLVNNGISTANDGEFVNIELSGGLTWVMFETGPIQVRPDEALIGIRAMSSGIVCSAFLIDKRCWMANDVFGVNDMSNFGGARGATQNYGLAIFLNNGDYDLEPRSAITEIGSVVISGDTFQNYTIYPNIYRDYQDWDFTNSALAFQFGQTGVGDRNVRISEIEVQLSGNVNITTEEISLHIPGMVTFANMTHVPSGFTYTEGLGEWVGDLSFEDFNLGFYPLQENSGLQLLPVDVGPTGRIDNSLQWTNFKDIEFDNYRTALEINNTDPNYGYLDVQTTGDFTVFFKLAATSPNSQILSKGKYPGNLEYGISIGENRTLELGAESTSNQYFNIESQIPNNDVIVAATYGPDNRFRLYHTKPVSELGVDYSKLTHVGTTDAFNRTITSSAIVLGYDGGLIGGINDAYISYLGFADNAISYSGLNDIVKHWNKLSDFVNDIPSSSRYINYVVEDYDEAILGAIPPLYIPVEDYYYQVDSPTDNRNGALSEEIASSSHMVLDMWISHNTNTEATIQPAIYNRYAPHRWQGYSIVIPSSEMTLYSISGIMLDDIYHPDNGNYHAAVGKEPIEILSNNLVYSGDFRSFLLSSTLNYPEVEGYYSDFKIHAIQLRTEAWLLPRTGEPSDDSIPLYIDGAPTNNSLDLFVEGAEREKSLDLFIHSVGVQSGDITLFLEGNTRGFMPLTIWSEPQGRQEEVISLFTFASAEDVSSSFAGFDLVIGGEFGAELPLFINADPIDTTSNLPLYIGATQEGTKAGFDLFLSNEYSVIYSGFPMFTMCESISSDASMPLFINRSNDSTSDHVDLYMSGPTLIDDNFPLYLEGANKFNDEITLFVSGNGVSTNSLTLYSHGF